MVDYHLHTPFCRHAAGPMEAYVEQAIRLGLQEICFTPHIPLPDFPRGDPNVRMRPEDIDRYWEALERLRGRYRQLAILAGVEADYYEGYEEYLRGFLARYPFDLVLMSVHFIRAWPGENWLFGFHFPHKPMACVYHEYLEEVKKGIRTGLYDCLAHLDLVKQPGQPLLDSNPQDVAEVIDLCAAAGMSVEVNTSGLRRPVREPYPSPGLLERIVRRGIPVVTGSDAHEPRLVAHAFAELERLFAGMPRLRRAFYRGRRMRMASTRDSEGPALLR